MIYMKDRHVLKPQRRDFSAPVLHHFVVLLLLTHSCGAQSQLICSDRPIVALAGDDVIFPCHLEPPVSASFETVLWSKPGLDPKYIHIRRDRQPVYQSQNPSYKNRTVLFVDQLLNGNVSVKIFRVKISDAGKYFCILQSFQKKASIQLTVGAVSTPVIKVSSHNSGEVVLTCESKGWYPEPEVSWLDAEGHVFSAGRTETVRGPDGLYTVSSRLTVEKRHNNNFTCRVQQKKINQIRETQIHVPDGFVTLQSSSFFNVWSIAVLLYGVALVITFVTVHVLIKKLSAVPHREPGTEMQNF